MTACRGDLASLGIMLVAPNIDCTVIAAFRKAPIHAAGGEKAHSVLPMTSLKLLPKVADKQVSETAHRNTLIEITALIIYRILRLSPAMAQGSMPARQYGNVVS